jgi:molybdopterin molybdotransferase
MRELLTVEQYQAELLALVRPDTRSEQLPLDQASGRVLAASVTSAISVPVFDNSAMDGYAVRFADVASVPARLRVVGDVPAGSPCDPEAGPGECVRIMTGAPLPTFADTVVPVEDTEFSGAVVTITSLPARTGAHVRRAGEDFAAGAVLAESGAELGPALVAALASVGATDVAVRPRPVVAVCATGDELVSDGSPLRRGQIYESNSLALTATLVRHGADARRAQPVGDRPEALVAWLESVTGAPSSGSRSIGGAGNVQLVVLTGGASVGAYDVVRDVLEQAGGTFRSVRVQPGKPQGWAVWNGVPVVSLPGNPVSAALSYELFVRPMLDRMLGRPERPWLTAVAATGWTSPPGRRQLVPVRFEGGADGRLLATPSHVRGSASHLVTSLAEADGVVAVAEDAVEVAVGDVLPARWL